MALVEYDIKQKIAYITLNRPEKRNAINFQMKDELVACLRRFDDDQDAWVAILSGNGLIFFETFAAYFPFPRRYT